MYNFAQKRNIVLVFIITFLFSMIYFVDLRKKNLEHSFREMRRAFELVLDLTAGSISSGYAQWTDYKDAVENRDHSFLDEMNTEILENHPFVTSVHVNYGSPRFEGDYFRIFNLGEKLLIDFRVFDDLGETSLDTACLRVDIDCDFLLDQIQNDGDFTFHPNFRLFGTISGKNIYRKSPLIMIHQVLASLVLSLLFSFSFERVIYNRTRFFYESRGLEKIISIFEHAEHYSADHSKNVAEIAHRLGQLYGLKGKDLKDLKIAALLHDIGKISVPVSILNKKEALTEEEFRLIQRHTIYSAQIIRDFEELSHLADCIRHHHEKMDGSGYPDKLKGQAIPLFSRIIAVADIFEALIGIRPYREPMSPEEALVFMDTLSLDRTFLSLLRFNYPEILKTINVKDEEASHKKESAINEFGVLV